MSAEQKGTYKNYHYGRGALHGFDTYFPKDLPGKPPFGHGQNEGTEGTYGASGRGREITGINAPHHQKEKEKYGPKLNQAFQFLTRLRTVTSGTGANDLDLSGI